MLTQEDVHKELMKQYAAYDGSVQRLAYVYEVKLTEMYAYIRKKRPIAGALLKRLGFRKVTAYEKV